MQEHIREVDAGQFSEVEKFREYKESGNLLAPEEVAKKIVSFLAKPEEYKEVVLRLSARN